MEQTISLPGSSAAYCPIELRKIQCALLASTELTIAQAVKVDMRLRIVKSAETMIMSPAQNDNDQCWPSCSSLRTEDVIDDELKRTPSSVESKSDMNIMFEENRCIMCSFKSFPFSIAQARCRLQMEKLSTVTKNSRILIRTRSDVQVLCE